MFLACTYAPHWNYLVGFMIADITPAMLTSLSVIQTGTTRYNDMYMIVCLPALVGNLGLMVSGSS
jgi:hypothetical protein